MCEFRITDQLLYTLIYKKPLVLVMNNLSKE